MLIAEDAYYQEMTRRTLLLADVIGIPRAHEVEGKQGAKRGSAPSSSYF
jgi:hypothetical protein